MPLGELVADVVRRTGTDTRVTAGDAEVMETDPRRVERIVVNLVANAHRHGGAPVEVTVAAARIAVRDHGPGSPAGLLDQGPPTVYVLDTGVRITHQDIAGRASYGWDFVDNDATAQDGNGHGTHVATTAAGTTYGVAKKAKIVAVRVLNNRGSGTSAGVIAGVDWITANHVASSVANVSLGGGATGTVPRSIPVHRQEDSARITPESRWPAVAPITESPPQDQVGPPQAELAADVG